MCKKLFIYITLFAVIFGIFPVSSLAESENINLVQGLTYTVQSGEPIDHSFGNVSEEDKIYDIDKGQLTDSQKATLSADSVAWYRAYKGVSRIIVFDLGKESRISYLKAGFLHGKNLGVYAPRYINVYLSDDGENYGVAAEFSTNYRLSSSAAARYDAVIKLDDVYSARYVKIEICCDKLLYCDEIEVFGSKTLSGNEAKVFVSSSVPLSGYPKSVAGVSNIVKIQNGYSENDPDGAKYIEREFLPYVAYIGQDGSISGTMFDGMIFCPCESVYPSGGSLVRNENAVGAVMSDVELYIERTFDDLYFLNLAVKRTYDFIGLDKKFKVFLTIPYPTSIDNPFGDIDNDGFDEYCRTFAERYAVVEWYINKCTEIFENSQFSHIALGGFCWGNDEIDIADSDHEAELVSEMNEYVRGKGLETLFSSSYLAVGFDSWQSFGFSDAVIQPNAVYSSKNGFDLAMLSECAETAYKYQMGVELETDSAEAFQGDNYLKSGFNYESYLYNGKKSGYINGLKTFSQGFGAVYYDFCYGDMSTPKGIYLRRLYDLTFDFIHLTYSNEPPELDVESEIELVNGDTNITLNVGITDTDSHLNDIKIEFPTMPSHGNVAAAANKKSLIYSTDEGFVGEDRFTVRVSDGFGYSEEYEIKVTVVPPEVFDNSSKEDVSNESVDIIIPANPNDGSVPLWLIIILVILALAMVVASVLVIAKSKNK